MDNKDERREQLYGLLGDLPPRDAEISAELLYTEERDHYSLEKLILNLNRQEPVPAYFIKPLKAVEKTPVVLFCHSHGGKYHLGKDELIQGNSYMQTPDYAQVLTGAGYSALCIDFWLFGERAGKQELKFFKETLWKGQVLWGMMVYDHLRAIDYLQTREDIAMNRLAVLGMSMGSTMAWWLAALDTRIKICADICCMTDFHALIEADGLNGHGIFYYVPSLLQYFSTADINSLIAPRAHLSVNGDLDPLTPPSGLAKIDEAMKALYAAEGAANAWLMKRYPVAHDETADMRNEVMSFLKHWL